MSSYLIISTLLVGQTVFAAFELACPNGKRIGTNLTTSDFLTIGTNCPLADDKGYLDSSSSSSSIGTNTIGSPIKMSCAIHSSAAISGITMTAPSSCTSTSANLANKYLLVKDADGAYYSVLHAAYGDWNNSATLVAKQCDPTGNFDSLTGCSGGTTATCNAITVCSTSTPVNAPIIDLNMNKSVETFATEIEIK